MKIYKMLKSEANPNFHTVGGKSVFRSKDPQFLEYRKNWQDRPKNFFAGEFPMHLDIAVSAVCNLRCPFCATMHDHYKPLNDQEFMGLDTFKKIIDEGAKWGLCAIKFNSGTRGEPLLNKYLPEMIAYAKSKGILDVYFNTNAVLLDREVGKKIIEAGLDRLSISFEGNTAEVYEKYRVGAKFEKVLKNIKDFIALREEMKKDKPLVRIQTVALPELAPALAEYSNFWQKIVDEVAFIDYKDYSCRQELVHDWACPFLWQRMLIKWNGVIAACCERGSDFNFYILGNINKGDSVRDAWKGKTMEELRAFHKKGQSHKVEMCNGCPFRTTEIMKLNTNK